MLLVLCAELHLVAWRSMLAMARGRFPRAVGKPQKKKKKTDKQKSVRMRQPVTLTGKVVLSFSSLASLASYRIKSLAAALGNGCGLAGAHGGNGAGPNPRGLPDGF